MPKFDLAKCVVGTDLDFTKVRFVRTSGLRNLGLVIKTVTYGDLHKIQEEFEGVSMQIIAKNPWWIDQIEKVFDHHVHCERVRLDERLWSTAARFLLFVEQRGFDPRLLYSKAVDAENAFWTGVGGESVLYEDAHHFRSILRELQLPVFGLTSSDARTRFQPDIGAYGRIVYEVEHSIAMKHHRLAPSGIFDLIPQCDVIVSDPWHKEDLRLWEERVFPRYPDRPDRDHWVFVGDTIYDMRAALVAGVGTRIFLARHAHTDQPAEATHTAHSLTEAAAIIRSLF
jgi:hypothetical protein